MLLVPTRLAQSAIHGFGVFAAEPIAKGTTVWRFEKGIDLELSTEDVDRLPGHVREFFAHFAYLDRNVKRIILCFDNARFMNHSTTHNLVNDYGADPYGIDSAARDIAAGEELTVDYAGFEERPLRF